MKFFFFLSKKSLLTNGSQLVYLPGAGAGLRQSATGRSDGRIQHQLAIERRTVDLQPLRPARHDQRLDEQQDQNDLLVHEERRRRQTDGHHRRQGQQDRFRARRSAEGLSHRDQRRRQEPPDAESRVGSANAHQLDRRTFHALRLPSRVPSDGRTHPIRWIDVRLPLRRVRKARPGRPARRRTFHPAAAR